MGFKTKDDRAVFYCCVVPDSASALAVGPIKPVINYARSEPGLVCILYHNCKKVNIITNSYVVQKPMFYSMSYRTCSCL